ncbi:MAG TPA: nuclear transport factor 2 family protein [Candidatus Binataceae bacterium]|nr:nuclear transport factor 2 family protein [Candidatus Binataceae bacterium]
MASEEQRRIAIEFLENFNRADPEVFARLITDDFRFEIVSSLEEFPPIVGRREFAVKEAATLKQLFPEGLKLEIETVIGDGPHVAVLAHADTVAMNGKRYLQRYAFYLRFEGDRIAEGREYNDTNLVREVFIA